VLWADSLGLVLEADGEGILSDLTVPPVSGVVVVWGGSGAIGGGEVIGVPTAGGWVGVAVACGTVGVVSFGADFDCASAGSISKTRTTSDARYLRTRALSSLGVTLTVWCWGNQESRITRFRRAKRGPSRAFCGDRLAAVHEDRARDAGELTDFSAGILDGASRKVDARQVTDFGTAHHEFRTATHADWARGGSRILASARGYERASGRLSGVCGSELLISIARMIATLAFSRWLLLRWVRGNRFGRGDFGGRCLRDNLPYHDGLVRLVFRRRA
jgi:hypothetical protein